MRRSGKLCSLSGIGPRVEQSGVGLIAGHASSAPHGDLIQEVICTDGVGASGGLHGAGGWPARRRGHPDPERVGRMAPRRRLARRPRGAGGSGRQHTLRGRSFLAAPDRSCQRVRRASRVPPDESRRPHEAVQRRRDHRASAGGSFMSVTEKLMKMRMVNRSYFAFPSASRP
jgi:hypothetical protein